VNRGDGYYGKGGYDEAIADYSEAIALGYDLAVVYERRGDVYFENDDYGKAIEDYTQAATLDPSLASAYLSRGDVYFRKDDYGRALADYEAALGIEGGAAAKEKIANAHFYLGEEYLDDEDDDKAGKAIEEYSKAIAFDPDYGDAYNSRGHIYYRRKDYDKAIADYEAAVRLYPDSAAIKNNLERARQARGQ
ncbi:MAG: tetratricopeptide repeat protein, partial [Treponema sp.]|jgi:tetratricopeptide (TPR) repeat protein|nr:tetratricopeptide repeat protein [Treponema sp.]